MALKTAYTNYNTEKRPSLSRIFIWKSNCVLNHGKPGRTRKVLSRISVYSVIQDLLSTVYFDLCCGSIHLLGGCYSPTVAFGGWVAVSKLAYRSPYRSIHTLGCCYGSMLLTTTLSNRANYSYTKFWEDASARWV